LYIETHDFFGPRAFGVEGFFTAARRLRR
jgi:hypothetical protein